jgi:hypothetical protein
VHLNLISFAIGVIIACKLRMVNLDMLDIDALLGLAQRTFDRKQRKTARKRTG